ncbi:MAG: hypothetical protein WHT09_08650 [Thermogutta sp.]
MQRQHSATMSGQLIMRTRWCIQTFCVALAAATLIAAAQNTSAQVTGSNAVSGPGTVGPPAPPLTPSVPSPTAGLPEPAPVMTPSQPGGLPTPADTSRMESTRGKSNRSEMPLPPTMPASPSRLQMSGGGWVSGEAALAGGPFPAYMTGLSSSQGGGWGAAPTRPIERPFSDYSPPASVSPYINLYRPEGAFGRVGNYYSLVRPMIQQQQTNRQISQRLRQMESPVQSGGGYVGRAAPTGGYFMNYYGYFPGLGGR